MRFTINKDELFQGIKEAQRVTYLSTYLISPVRM